MSMITMIVELTPRQFLI